MTVEELMTNVNIFVKYDDSGRINKDECKIISKVNNFSGDILDITIRSFLPQLKLMDIPDENGLRYEADYVDYDCGYLDRATGDYHTSKNTDIDLAKLIWLKK